MRILHLDAGRTMGGGQWQALRLIEGLAAAGVESTLLAREGSPLFHTARRGGWRVEPLGLFRAVRYSRRHELIHAHDARTHTMATLVRRIPLVVARRVAFPIGAEENRLGSKWKYARAQHYIAVSEFVRGVLVSGGVRAEKISVVYDGVPPLLESTAGGKVFALQKGASLAGEAARVSGVPIEIAADLEQDLLRASLLVYISHAEGLGSAVLLAMSAGVPVIASDTGGLPEIVKHRKTGLLVENRPEAIAAAIRELLDNPALARGLAGEARRMVLEHFTVERMVRRTMEVYRQVLV
jgi:glycosyltransferase involved in cell wall biosynthesis